MSRQVIVIGAGGHGRVVAEAIKAAGDEFVGFLDDNMVSEDVIGKVSDCEKFTDKFFLVAIGDNEARKRICNQYQRLNYYTLIHKTAQVSKTATIGEGSMIMANVVINAGAKIGQQCILNTASIVEHDCDLGDYVQISPRAVLCGTVTVGESGYIGAGAVVKNNINVCENSIIGAGCVVVKDIDKPNKYVGVPARCLE